MQGASLCAPFSLVSILEQKMNSSTKGVPTAKHMALNPNAAEFIPLSQRAASGNTNKDVTKLEAAGNCGKAVLDRTESTISSASDDETRQYWRFQLPDDITPDFREDDLLGSDGFVSGGSAGVNYSLSPKPVATESETANGQLAYNKRQHINPSHDIDFSGAGGKSRFAIPHHGDGISSSVMSDLSAANVWDQFAAVEQQLVKSRDGYSDECDVGFLNELLGEQTLQGDGEMTPVEFLATEFPGFAAESLADIYYANGGDLSLTIEMLTQLELQDDAGSHQSLNAKSLSSPNLTVMDFPALSSSEMLDGMQHYTEDEVQQAVNMFRTGEADKLFFSRPNVSGNPRSASDFAAVVRKSASQHSGQWKYERNGSMDLTVGSSRNPQVSASSFEGNGRVINGDRLQSYTNTRQTPQLWLETGDAVGNMYSDLREEARDHARVRNAYFEQARQAYLVGNKALAKELSAKGQWHNAQMKAAHGRAGEAIYRQRNLATAHLQNFVQGQDRLIDLHGLHVNEAIHVLKHELTVLRNTARSTCQRQQLLICVGTGHHTKGSRTPARLPVAVERYLLEDEHLDYTEPQPGMLRVVIY
eukprot:Gb_15842 [translate_table: standard]